MERGNNMKTPEDEKKIKHDTSLRSLRPYCCFGDRLGPLAPGRQRQKILGFVKKKDLWRFKNPTRPIASRKIPSMQVCLSKSVRDVCAGKFMVAEGASFCGRSKSLDGKATSPQSITTFRHLNSKSA